MAPDKNIRILVADDSNAVRRIVLGALRELGFRNVVEAADGEAAWDVLQSQPVDLVLCDIKMPKMNGLEVLEKVRAMPEYETLPFIMITAEAGKDTVIDAVKKGCTGYIVKPFNVKTLGQKILKAM